MAFGELREDEFLQSPDREGVGDGNAATGFVRGIGSPLDLQILPSYESGSGWKSLRRRSALSSRSWRPPGCETARRRS